MLEAFTPLEDNMFGITDPSDGLQQFSIRDIDPAGGLDPNNTESFVAGLEFSSPFVGEVQITPLVLNTVTDVDPPGTSFTTEAVNTVFAPAPVAEPSTLLIFGTGIAGVALMRRRTTRRLALARRL